MNAAAKERLRRALSDRLDQVVALGVTRLASVQFHDIPGYAGTNVWYASDMEFGAALDAISEGARVRVSEIRGPTARPWAAAYVSNLPDWLGSPINFSSSAAQSCREETLRRLMVADRRSLLSDLTYHPTVGLRLELVTLHASQSDDLRFIDAANSYYETSFGQHAQAEHFRALYAAALSAWLDRLRT